jgi:hypothetical protein
MPGGPAGSQQASHLRLGKGNGPERREGGVGTGCIDELQTFAVGAKANQEELIWRTAAGQRMRACCMHLAAVVVPLLLHFMLIRYSVRSSSCSENCDRVPSFRSSSRPE